MSIQFLGKKREWQWNTIHETLKMTNERQQQEVNLKELPQWNKGVYIEIKNNGQDMGYDGNK